MNHRLLQLTLVAAAALSGAGSAHAELITLPEVPITVADCKPGFEWKIVGGLARCAPRFVDTCQNHGYWPTDQGGGSAWVPGVGTCYNQAPPPVYVPPPVSTPTCMYSNSNGNPYFMVVVGPANCNGADSGCAGTAVAVAWGTSGFGVFNNRDYLDGGTLNNGDPDNLQRTVAWVDATLKSWGYFRGAYRGGNIGNGNYDSSDWYEVCRR